MRRILSSSTKRASTASSAFNTIWDPSWLIPIYSPLPLPQPKLDFYLDEFDKISTKHRMRMFSVMHFALLEKQRHRGDPDYEPSHDKIHFWKVYEEAFDESVTPLPNLQQRGILSQFLVNHATQTNTFLDRLKAYAGMRSMDEFELLFLQVVQQILQSSKGRLDSMVDSRLFDAFVQHSAQYGAPRTIDEAENGKRFQIMSCRTFYVEKDEQSLMITLDVVHLEKRNVRMVSQLDSRLVAKTPNYRMLLGEDEMPPITFFYDEKHPSCVWQLCESFWVFKTPLDRENWSLSHIPLAYSIPAEDNFNKVRNHFEFVP